MCFIRTAGLVICLLLVGINSVQSFRNNHLGKGCVKNASYIPLPHKAEVYYSYYSCNGTQDNFDEHIRSTIIFVGTPEVSGSGYYEFNIFKEVLSLGSSLLLQKFDLVFIDMPGIGYSRISNETYLYNIGKTLEFDIATVITAIVKIHDKIAERDFYLYAESWGTKILPYVALTLYNISNIDLQHKFQGIFLGSPFVSPMSQLATWPDHLFSQGSIDKSGYLELNKDINKIKDAAAHNKRKFATSLYKKLEDTIIDITSGVNQCDFTDDICMEDLQLRAFPSGDMKELKTLIKCRDNDNHQKQYLKELMNRHKPHGWNYKWNSQEREVIRELGIDLMVDHTVDVVSVLDGINLNVFVISGRNDLVSGPSASHHWLDNLNWSGSEDFLSASFVPFKDSYWSPYIAACYGTAGYFKRYGLLQVFNVFDVGHRIFKQPYLIDNSITKVFDLAVNKQKNKEDNDNDDDPKIDTTPEYSYFTIKPFTMTVDDDVKVDDHKNLSVLERSNQNNLFDGYNGINKYGSINFEDAVPEESRYMLHLCYFDPRLNRMKCLNKRSLNETAGTNIKTLPPPDDESKYPDVVAVPLNHTSIIDKIFSFSTDEPRVD